MLDEITRKYYPVKAYLDRIPKDKLKVSTSITFFNGKELVYSVS